MTAVRMDSLRQKTLALFLVALAVLLTIQGAYFSSVLYINHQSAEDYADFSAQQVCSTTRQVFQNYDNALCQLGQNRDVQDLFMETDPYQYYLSYNAVQTVCRSMSQVQEGIENILLLDLEGGTEYYLYALHDRPLDLEGLGLTLEDLGGPAEKSAASASVFLVTNGSGGERFFCCARPVTSTFLGKQFGTHIGYALLMLKAETVSGLFWERDGQGIYLVDREGGTAFPEAAGGIAGSRYVKREEVLSTGWEIVVDLNPRNMMRHYFSVLFAALGTALTMVLLLVGWFILNHRLITRPMLTLTREIGELDRNGLSGRIAGRYPGEIGMMAQSVNHLLDRLQQMARNIFRLQDQMYESELREKETRLYALQAQVNPHFLFNTLQCIAGIAAAHGEEEIVGISLSLSRIFHYAVRSQGEITVRRELAMTEEYLKIIEVRFMGKYRYAIDVDPALYGVPCQKMILQPLVENAVLHGLENTYRDGLVRICGRRQDGKAVFSIADNGCGIPAERLAELKRSISDPEEARRRSVKTDRIGLANVQSRIQAVYGPAYGLAIDSAEGEGTVVTLTLPLPDGTPP